MKRPASDSPYQRFYYLTFLNILSNLTIPLAGIVDTAVLGNYTDAVFIAGVSLGTVLFDYLYWGCTFLRMGTTGTTAIRSGQGDLSGVYLVLFRSLGIGLILGLSIWILSPWIADLVFPILGGTDELKEIGRVYFRNRVWDAPFTMMNFVFVGWFLGRGRSDIVLGLTFISNSLNIGLDLYFVKSLGMNADGVAIASGLAQVLQFSLSGIFVFVLFFSKREFKAPYKNNSYENFITEIVNGLKKKSEFFAILSFNKDIFLRSMFLILTFSLFRNFSADLGNELLTVNTILLQFMLVFAFFVDGAAFATETLAGDLYGKRKGKDLDRILNTGILFGLGVSFLFIFLLLAIPMELIGLITKDVSVWNLTLRYLPGLYGVLVLGSIAFIYDGFFLGIVKGHILRNSMFISTFLVFIPISLSALYFQNNDLLWLGLACFMGSRALTLYFAKNRVVR